MNLRHVYNGHVNTDMTMERFRNDYGKLGRRTTEIVKYTVDAIEKCSTNTSQIYKRVPFTKPLVTRDWILIDEDRNSLWSNMLETEFVAKDKI